MTEGDVTPDRFAELLASGEAEFVDVRTDAEREAGHIAGTKHIPFDELFARASELDPGKPVVFYCRSGDRSTAAAEAFAASGRDAQHLAGGIAAWVDAGHAIEPEDGRIAEPSAMPPA